MLQDEFASGGRKGPLGHPAVDILELIGILEVEEAMYGYSQGLPDLWKNKRVRLVDACSSQTLPKRGSYSEYEAAEENKSTPQNMYCLKNL